MLLTNLRDFEWYNEPEDVSFEERGMAVLTKNKTDFWQSKHHNFKKDDGHFFFTRRTGNFTLDVKWIFEPEGRFDQCGIMVRIDERNWFKASVMYDNPSRPMLGSCVTNNGYSDWAAQKIPEGVSEVWYRVKRNNGDYLIFYSLDGEQFEQIRLLHLINDTPEVKAGAYTCSPQRGGVEAVLTKLEFS